jgi:hypothetical protein
MDVYYDSSVIYNEETESYDFAEGIEGPDFVRTITVSDSIGERTETNPYSPEDLVYESFDLIDDSYQAVENGASYNTVVGQMFKVYVSDALPETASPSVDEIVVTAYQDGEETYSVFGGYDFEEDWSGVRTFVYVTAYQPGTYTIEVKTQNVTKTFTIVAGYAPVESFVVAVYDDGMWDYVETSEAEVVVNQQVDFMALVNEGANKNYTVSYGAEYENISLEEGWNGEYYFSASVAGTYEIILTSEADSSITATLTVIVNDAPSQGEGSDDEVVEGEGIVGTWTNVFIDPRMGMEYLSTLVFNADGTGEYEIRNGLYVGSFTYVEVDGEITISDVVSLNESAAPTLQFFVDPETGNYVMIAQEGMNLYHVGECTKA